MKNKKKELTKQHPIIKEKIEQSLKLSIQEGSAAAAATATGESYFVPFALLLNATATQIGILTAIITLLPSIIQLKTSTLIETYSRKKIVLQAKATMILLWIPILICGYLYYKNTPHIIWALILIIGLYYAALSIAQMTWFSWIGSLVPEHKRGIYFSRRNKITGFWSIITMILGAVLLDSTKKIGIIYGKPIEFTIIGFALLFMISLTLTATSYIKLQQQYEPKIIVRKKDQFSFRTFLRKITTTPFGKFVLFRGIMSISITIASPFWAVYMLRNLGFSYFWFMTISMAGIAFQLLFFPLMGKAADKYGNIAIIKTCINLSFLAPLAWLITPLITNPTTLRIYLLLVPSTIAGFVWSGYNLATNNYVYDAVKPSKRSFGISYTNLSIGIGGFLGATIGAYLASLPITFMNPLLFIFAISALTRLITATIGTKYLEEVRTVKKFKTEYIIKELTPINNITKELQHLEQTTHKLEHYI